MGKIKAQSTILGLKISWLIFYDKWITWVKEIVRIYRNYEIAGHKRRIMLISFIFWLLYLDWISHTDNHAAMPNLTQASGRNPQKCILVNWLKIRSNIIYHDNLHVSQSKFIVKINLVISHFQPILFLCIFFKKNIKFCENCLPTCELLKSFN